LGLNNKIYFFINRWSETIVIAAAIATLRIRSNDRKSNVLI